MDNQDLYWLAGLLEGEGSFQKPAPSDLRRPRITIQMTDLEVIQRVAKLFGRNYIHVRQPQKKTHNTSYSTMTKGTKAIALMQEMYPLMGMRRKTQIESALACVEEHPNNTTQILEEYQLFWLAGLLEAEGSFMKGPPSTPNKPRIHIKMTDLEIIQNVAMVFSSKYYGPYKVSNQNVNPDWKPYYVTWLFGKKAFDLMKQLYPLMSKKRQRQIDEVSSSYNPERQIFGEKHPQAKLTAEKVSDIKRRLAAGEKLTALAAEYDVDRGLVWQIKAGRIWRHVS